MEKLENLKLELTELRQIKVKGSVIRSRATNLVEKEKSTKYFCSLETHNYLSKIISKLEKADGRIITVQHDILKESELALLFLSYFPLNFVPHKILSPSCPL